MPEQNWFEQFNKHDDKPDDFFNQFQSVEPTAKPIDKNEPDTWMKGFINSITSGDALSAGLSGAKGFAEGAIADLPSSIYHGIKNTVTHPLDTFLSSMGPLGDLISDKDSMEGVRNLSANAGNNPEEFGRMMGQMTGQPLVTAGMFKATPTATRLSGYPVELLGKGVKRYGVGMPRIFESRLQRGVERGVGSIIESVGKGMKRVGTVKQGELVTEDMPNVINGEYTVKGPKELPPSKVFHYGEQGLQEGEELIPKNYKVIRNETSNVNKPKFRTNGDGTFTNLETGEVLDSKGQSIVEINGKSPETQINDPFMNYIKDKTSRGIPLSSKDYDLLRQKSIESLDTMREINKNSPFFTRNRRP